MYRSSLPAFLIKQLPISTKYKGFYFLFSSVVSLKVRSISRSLMLESLFYNKILNFLSALFPHLISKPKTTITCRKYSITHCHSGALFRVCLIISSWKIPWATPLLEDNNNRGQHVPYKSVCTSCSAWFAS
jgi:hypothetical protein